MPESERFRAIATAMLDRRIRNMRRLDEKTWIDTSLITHAEYQLFLDDMYTQGKYHQPDHWKEKRFSPGQAQTPVVGVRPSDAVAFCEWLTAQGWGTVRLPHQEETTGLENSMPGFWQFNNEEIVYQGNKVESKKTTLEVVKRLREMKVPDLTLDQALALEHANDHEYTLAHAIGEDIVRKRTLSRTLDRNPERSYDRTRALDQARSLFLNNIFELENVRERRKIERKRQAIDLVEFEKSFELVMDSTMTLAKDLILLTLRREGLLPAFEGILIVREETD